MENDVSTKLDVLAASQYRSGNFADACTTLQKLLSYKIERYGESSEEAVKTMGNLAAALASADDLLESDKWFVKALEGKQRLLGERHPETLLTMNHVAVLRKRQGKLRESEVLLDECTKELIAVASNNDPLKPILAEASYNFGIVSVQLGNWKRACEMFSLSHRMFTEVSSDNQQAMDALHWELRSRDRLETMGEDVNDCSQIATAESEAPNNLGRNSVRKTEEPRKFWVHSTQCQLCSTTYTMSNREHHCRACSRSVCHNCSSKTTFITLFNPTKPVRCCIRCYQQGF